MEEKRERKEDIKPLALKGSVNIKKKSVWNKFSETFTGDGKMVKDYVIYDVLIPSLKRIVQDAITNGIDIFLNGDKGNRARRASTSYDRYGGTRVSYRTYYDDENRRTRYDDSYRRRLVSLDNLNFTDESDAYDTIDYLDEIISRYGYVEVVTLFEKLQLSCPYTYNEYGWNSLTSARVERGRDGLYYLILPRPILIERNN